MEGNSLTCIIKWTLRHHRQFIVFLTFIDLLFIGYSLKGHIPYLEIQPKYSEVLLCSERLGFCKNYNLASPPQIRPSGSARQSTETRSVHQWVETFPGSHPWCPCWWESDVLSGLCASPEPHPSASGLLSEEPGVWIMHRIGQIKSHIHSCKAPHGSEQYSKAPNS